MWKVHHITGIIEVIRKDMLMFLQEKKVECNNNNKEDKVWKE